MASGLPVMASKIPGNSELVLQGETGFLFELADRAALISAFMQLRDTNLRLHMGEHARKRAIQFFSWRSVASRYVDLFAGTVSKR
jgi:glycosyltransferase involved in cell wall biosynthesis